MKSSPPLQNPQGWATPEVFADRGAATRLLLAEGHLNRRRFGAVLGRIAVLPLRTG
ncbi:MAG: hypothetical protein ACYDCG_21080 [Candidatus Acidiferrales bacterium]